MGVLKQVRALAGAFALMLSLLCRGSYANAEVSLLVEEPFGHFGAFTATGHAAVYLSGVCAASPTTLRRCEPGENGVVISRYDKVGGYDWIAIPLVPYLYAVDSAGDVPLYADPKLVAFLRNQYRREHLESVAPDRADGEPPTGNWVQLVGSSYDRAIYSLRIETSSDKDDEFIREFNSQSNDSHFNLLARNCADFAKKVINFYEPKAVHRSLMADVGITTPKQLAKSLTKFSSHHPELELATFVIPQVPGSMGRSTPVHGVVESLLKSKKYLVPLAVLHPIVTGGLAVAYVGGGRFDPAKNAKVLNSGSELGVPLEAAERRSYSDQLNHLLLGVNPEIKSRSTEQLWHGMNAEPEFDAQGHPALHLQLGEESVDMGVSRDNLLSSHAPAVLEAELLTARLREELKRGSNSKVSASDVAIDWSMLNQILPVATLASSGSPATDAQHETLASNTAVPGGARATGPSFRMKQ